MLLVYNLCTLARLTPDHTDRYSLLKQHQIKSIFVCVDGQGLMHGLPGEAGDEAGWGIKELGIGLVWYLRTVVLRLYCAGGRLGWFNVLESLYFCSVAFYDDLKG